MENTSGFFKVTDGELFHAPNFVYAPSFTLLREQKDEYPYPVDGWIWFDDTVAAQAALLATPSVE